MSRELPASSPAESKRRRRPLLAGIAVLAVAAAAVAGVSIAAINSDDSSEQAAPDVAALAGPLAEQTLDWEDCAWNDDGQPIEGADVSNVECATVQVPRDWHDPDPDRTWDVRISFASNIDPADAEYHTTIITHPGGPDTSGLSYGSTVQMYTPELQPTTNYVSFDQRGLGRSSHAGCEYEYDPADRAAAVSRAIGEACAADPDVATMTTEQTAYDMDFIRHLLDIDSVTYVGYSYGSWLGTWFGSLFAENIERMVFDSSVDTTADSIQALYESSHEGRDRQFRLHMMNWFARNDATVGLGADPEVIWERYFAATASPQMSLAARYAWTSTPTIAAFSNPIGYPYAASLVRAIIAEGESATAPVIPAESAARIIERTEMFTADQRAASLAVLAAASAPVGEPGETIAATYDEVIDFTKCTDGQWTQGLDYWEDFNERTAAVAPFSEQVGLLDGPQTCAFWPTDSAMPAVDDSFPETIVLQSELDSMTPFEQGHAAGTQLPNASLIAVDNESAHGVFPYGTEEVDGPVVAFLLGGARPSATIVAPGKPMPLEDISYESWTPLDVDARHSGRTPRFTDPLIPAGLTG